MYDIVCDWLSENSYPEPDYLDYSDYSENDLIKIITVKQAKDLLINIATYVHIRKFETGNRTNLKRSISVCRYAYNEYKNIFDNISLVNNLIRFIKNIQHDRNINIIRLLVPIHTGN